MPRRSARIAILAALLLAPVVAHAEGTKITFFIWAGSNQGVVPREVFAAYKAQHPDVTINELESNNAVTYPQMVAARRTTPDNPLVDCGFFNVDAVTRGDVDDMWESLDPAKIPNMKNVLPKFARPDNRGVAYQMSAIGLMYNKNAVKNPPDTWSVLWDPAYKGRVVAYDYDTRLLAIAARMNGGSEKDIDPGFKIWSQHADNFLALINSNDALKNAMSTGEAWVAPWWSAIADVWIQDGSPFTFVIPKEGPIAFPLYLGIVKGVTAAQRGVCEDLINMMLDGKAAGRYAELTRSIALVSNATMSPAQMNDPALNIDLAKNAIVLDYPLIAQQTADWHRRWDREVKRRMK